MITPSKARQDYEAAIETLSQIAVAPETSAAARAAARNSARELTRNYLDTLEMEFHALTAQYQEFIVSMNDLIDEISNDASIADELIRLTAIVTAGSAIIGTATGTASGQQSRTMAATPKRALKSKAAEAVSTSNSIKLLCVHGIGHHESDPTSETSWRKAIADGLKAWSLARPFEIQFVAYDELFANTSLDAIDLAEAVFKLSASGIVHGIGDLFRKPRGFADVSDTLRWTAGMVAQWAANDQLRKEACTAVKDHIARFQPDIILAHSLGSLICYDLFRTPTGAALLNGRVWVTFGSQIGNPFVRDALGGRIAPIESARQWFHLFNPHDDAFTAPLRIKSSQFQQVDASFDIPGMLDHDAVQYLSHANTGTAVWRYVAQDLSDPKARTLQAPSSQAMQQQASLSRKALALSKPRHRALLVGINDYPNPANRLEGCVNDVFLMSSVLQECGFRAEDIRVVLNDRATAKGVLERIDWLLDGAQDGHNRVLFYSGHGAQIPTYGFEDKADHLDECLVTYDFNWSSDTAVTDDQFYELYSQLPEAANFLAAFDCCHSGGMTRDGGLRVRGLNPPDDIRHRALKWNMELQMWEERTESKGKSKGVGSSKLAFSVRRLGCRAFLPNRGPENKAYSPILLEACQEQQFSYEYRHGVTSYGAFTYCLARIFRQTRIELENGRRKQMLSWRELTDAVAQNLKQLHYNQTPNLVCPPNYADQPVPWKK